MQDASDARPGTDHELILLARLVRPQGRHGEILADILTDFPERFSERKRLFLLKPGASSSPPPREITLERHWLHKGRVVLKFSGIDSINDAELLRGLEVAIPSEERAPLEGDAVYISDLIGCSVWDRHGALESEAAGSEHEKSGARSNQAAREVGKIVDVDRESTAHPLLVVRGAGTGEVLIPFVKAFLLHVDLAAGRIEMDLPEGLLELNAPLTAEERARQLLEQRAEVRGGAEDGETS